MEDFGPLPLSRSLIHSVKRISRYSNVALRLDRISNAFTPASVPLQRPTFRSRTASKSVRSTRLFVDLATLIGIWESDGKTALIVEREGDMITIQEPKNEVWRVEFIDAQVVENAISFTRRSYLIDGSSHPFNGVPCECMISSQKGNSDAIVYALTTIHSKHIPPCVMQRAKA